jgi:hypothetical protein
MSPETAGESDIMLGKSMGVADEVSEQAKKPEQCQVAHWRELYECYLSASQEITPNGRYMPYRWTNLPNPISGMWLIYGEMLREFAAELANTINILTNDVHRLRAWSVVLAPLSTEKKMEALLEFIQPLAVSAIGLPYVIKSRFAYSVAHLSHHANRAKDPGWKDEFPGDGTIYLNDADPFGRRWRSYRAFKLRVERIAAKKYKDATGDFRNAYNHRFPRHLIVGSSGTVTRSIDSNNGRPVYAIGGSLPLGLDDVASLLSKERDLSYKAFAAFQDLVGEQTAAIAQAQLIGGSASIR